MDEIQVFREVLLSLYSAKRATPDDKHNIGDLLTGGWVAPIPRLISDYSQLEKLLPSTDGKARISNEFRNACIYLTAPERAQKMAPLLNISYDFYCDIPKIALRLGLFTFEVVNTRKMIKGFGFRYESPEGMGPHHFYHAQLIKGFKKHQPFPPHCCKDWFFDKEPTLPLDAVDSVDLLLCLIASLYGRDETLEFFNSIVHRDAKKIVSDKIESMRLNVFRAVERFWYWQVTTQAGETTYYKTRQNPDDFGQLITNQYPGCSHSLLSASDRGAIEHFTVFP